LSGVAILDTPKQGYGCSFTEKQEKYIQSLVAAGDYQNASEAVRDAVRLHQIYRDRMIEDLKREIEKGWRGASSMTVRDIVAEKKRLRQ